MPWISALLITLWVLFYYTTPIPWATAVLALLLGAYTKVFGLTRAALVYGLGFYYSLFHSIFPSSGDS